MTVRPFDDADEYLQQTFTALTVASGAKIAEKHFEDCHFQDCSFQETELFACIFRDCSFTACNLSVARFTNLRFTGVCFKRSKLTGVDWTAAQWSSVAPALSFEERCVLDLDVFMGLKLPNSVFRDSSAHEVDFSEADLTGSDFSGTDLAKARFSHTNLTKARFEGAYNYAISLKANTLKGASFSLPEAASLLEVAGIKVVDPPEAEGL
jgi:fluoroquinolone resistance protein